MVAKGAKKPVAKKAAPKKAAAAPAKPAVRLLAHSVVMYRTVVDSSTPRPTAAMQQQSVAYMRFIGVLCSVRAELCVDCLHSVCATEVMQPGVAAYSIVGIPEQWEMDKSMLFRAYE
jgi:hypothetical protein